MRNYLKYGKISEICGINSYFAGGKKKKMRQRHQKFPPAGMEIHTYISGGGGEV